MYASNSRDDNQQNQLHASNIKYDNFKSKADLGNIEKEQKEREPQ
jgi:hypothetical protein